MVFLYLGYESIVELWNLIQIMKYRIQMLNSQQFTVFYQKILKSARETPGELKKNIENLLHPLLTTNSENVYCMLELLHIYPTVLLEDAESYKLGEIVDNLEENFNGNYYSPQRYQTPSKGQSKQFKWT